MISRILELRKDARKRFTLLKTGKNILWAFLIIAAVTTVYYGVTCYIAYTSNDISLYPSVILLLLIIAAEFILFWVGIIIVYYTSVQLGFKYFVLGALLGSVPVANLIMFFVILRIIGKEVKYELARCDLNDSRKAQKICGTKYPILLVHGVFFRDYKHHNYWSRIPRELINNGATIYYGEHHSAASVDDCGKELEQRIRQIIEENGYEKLNVIAHSKGGLDMRAALSNTSAAQYVASLTTISTPHRGCEFADYLINKIPQKKLDAIASTYNRAALKLGDIEPDFITAVKDLTAVACKERNETLKDAEGVYYQSFGSVLVRPSAGSFPLNMTYRLVNMFDGRNDGLVGEESFAWGSSFEMVASTGKRGISHGDIIDLNHENLDGFEVREFYIQLVAKLKEKGF